MSRISHHSQPSGSATAEGGGLGRRVAGLLADLPDTFLVGGTVRDIIMGRPCADYDIATGQPPEAVAQALARRTAGRVVPFVKAAETVFRVASPQDGIFDISGIRGSAIEDDLAHRDFTINAMAMPPATGRIIDPLGGRADIARRRIHLAGPRAFENDPVRMLRAYRFGAAFDFSLSGATQSAVAAHRARLASVAGERIRQEWLKLLAATRAAPHLNAMATSGLLAQLIPPWQDAVPPPARPRPDMDAMTLALETVAALESTGAPGPPLEAPGLVKLAALMADLGRTAIAPAACRRAAGDPGAVPRTIRLAEGLMDRWRLSRRERTIVTTLLAAMRRPDAICAAWAAARPVDLAATRFFMMAGPLSPAAIMLSQTRRTIVADWRRRRGGAGGEACYHYLKDAYQTAYRRRTPQRPLLSGRDVMALLALPPGPLVGRLLADLRRHQLAGRVATPDEARQLVTSRFRACSRR